MALFRAFFNLVKIRDTPFCQNFRKNSKRDAPFYHFFQKKGVVLREIDQNDQFLNFVVLRPCCSSPLYNISINDF